MLPGGQGDGQVSQCKHGRRHPHGDARQLLDEAEPSNMHSIQIMVCIQRNIMNVLCHSFHTYYMYKPTLK